MPDSLQSLHTKAATTLESNPPSNKTTTERKDEDCVQNRIKADGMAGI